MAKKSGVNISRIAVIRVIVFLFIGFILFTAYVNTSEFLTTSPLFEVKDVMIDRSIQFIDLRVLKQLKGSNIFKIDRQFRRRNGLNLCHHGSHGHAVFRINNHLIIFFQGQIGGMEAVDFPLFFKLDSDDMFQKIALPALSFRASLNIIASKVNDLLAF